MASSRINAAIQCIHSNSIPTVFHKLILNKRVQLINVNSKMRKIEIIFKAKKAHLPLGENIIFSKDIDSLDLQYFMRLCRI